MHAQHQLQKKKVMNIESIWKRQCGLMLENEN